MISCAILVLMHVHLSVFIFKNIIAPTKNN
jgi:hypothetical protein